MWLVALVIFLVILIIWTNRKEHASNYLVPYDYSTPINATTANVWTDLTEGEKLNYLVDRYFANDTEERSDAVSKQNQYIKNLPRSSECPDSYDGCPAWALAGECDINPEFMLYNCPKSCQSCKLSPQQKQNVTAIMNNRDPPGCVYHGIEYPGPTAYREKTIDYYNGVY